MPTPAPHITLQPQAIVRYIKRDYSHTGSTGSVMYAYEDDSFFHSNKVDDRSIFEGTLRDISNSNSDKKFINFKNDFKNQFEMLAPYFANLDFVEADEKLSTSLSSILESNPDAISMELTHEQSVFYTIKKRDYTFFIQHFLNEIDEDDDEAILTAFEGDLKLPSYAGSLSQAISELSRVLKPVNNVKFHLEFNELSI